MTGIIGNLIGGIGLLLIGMALMTDGLKLASGNALREILGTWTRTRLRGFMAGIVVTGIVQSSGAVTVATIGFANAGMLSLERAIWVIYGSNVGSTIIGWVVALIGFQFNIAALALPLVGLGALLKFTGVHTRRTHAGIALVGFGLMFLGISYLKGAFEHPVISGDFPALDHSSLPWLLLYVLIGVVLATLMQSSTAALVITLSAAAGGFVPIETAAAIVIGANIGTTTTGLLSVIGATPNAKRVAYSHVIFNVASALVGIFILGPPLSLTHGVERLLGLAATPVVTIAIFQTVLNFFGVAMMWPFTPRLVRELQRRFSTPEELAANPQHLDKSLLSLPYLATDAVVREVSRINHHTLKAIEISLHFHQEHPQTFEEHRIVRKLADEVGKFTVELSRTELTPVLSATLANLMESTQQFLLAIDIVEDIALMNSSARQNLHKEVLSALEEFLACVHRHLAAQDLGNSATLKPGMQSYDEVEIFYRKLKDEILRSAARGELDMEGVDVLLQYINQAKRACRQLVKATQRVITVSAWLRHTPQF